METEKVVANFVDFLQGKKAKDISIINIEKVSILADYFIICSGSSTTQIKAISDELELKADGIGCKCLHKEGYESARWILLDYSDIVVHIFHDEDRHFYNLERLWSDGKVTYK